VAVEDPGVGGAGRVRVSDFYGQALNNGKWQFSESLDYLRQMGALDEADPSNPRVIIPNYIYGPSNCGAASSYYSVCCLDECEGILGRLEQLISAPDASPSAILSMVPMIASSTMPSSRTLSPWLHQRLDEVAKHHGGLVPLHGRLFAQWLHYAYPRECAFPHAAGTIDPMHPQEYMRVHNVTAESLSTNETDWQRHIEEAAPQKLRVPGTEALAHEESAMWSMHEELVVWRPTQQSSGFYWLYSASGRALVMVAAVVSLSIALVRNLEPALKNIQNGKGASEKYYV